MTGKEITSLYNQFVDDLFTYGQYLGFEKEVVRDAIHDVFLKLHAERKFLTDVKNTKFYLFRSLKNRLIDIHKYKREFVTLEGDDSSLELPFMISVNVEDSFIENEEGQQIKSQIEEMLNSLTDRQREVIYLRYVQEYDYDQIAQLLGISVHGCRKLVSRAIISLREKFGILIAFLLTI